MSRKLVLYISMSLDGFIATKEDDLSWLSTVQVEGEDYGYEAFNETVDTYIVGRRTYEVVLGLTGGVFPAAEKHQCYVITKQERADENGVTFYNSSIEDLVNDLMAQEGKNIYCDGGAQIVQLLLQKNLIDEFIISVIPILLGDGKRLFLGDSPLTKLKLLESKQYESGLVQLRYSNVKIRK